MKRCPECNAANLTRWVKENPEYKKNYYHLNKEKQKSYYKQNQDKEKTNMKQWRSLHKEEVKTYLSEWRRLNRGKCNALNKRYEASKLQATPNWLTVEQLRQIELYYLAAKWIEFILEEQIDVDHIIPLQGKNVRGLHVPWNLQLLTHADNLKKSNK
jgi:hypothetical protein